MTRTVITAHPDDSVRAVVELMCNHGCRAIPVVDGKGFVVGMMTGHDVRKAVLAHDEALRNVSAGTAMSRRVYVCHENDSIEVAEGVMRANRLRRLPVEDARGRLVGIVTSRDLAPRAEIVQPERTRVLRAPPLARARVIVAPIRRTGS